MPQFMPGEKSIWFIPWVKKRLSENRNVIGVYVGDTGSGKSLSAISSAVQIEQALKLDPGFTSDRICFTVGEIVKWLRSGKLKPGNVLIFDDAGLEINARQWMKSVSIIFGMITQGFRYMQIILLITVPKMSFIERQSRNLIHVRFDATPTQGIMKPKIPFTSPYDDDKLWYKFPKIKVGFKTTKITTVRFPMPPSEIVEPYEKRKAEYIESKLEAFDEILNGREREGTDVTCPNCAYSWTFRGYSNRVTCTNCGHQFYRIEKVDFKSGYDVECNHCKYRWRFTGTAKRTSCPNCEEKVYPEKCRVKDDDDPDISV